MSDHWNGIASLLGTPSLNPVSKKTDSPPKTPKPVAIQAEESPVNEVAVEPQAELPTAKPKQEPSRLRSSWDAVAQFFGVAAPEPAQSITSPKADESVDSQEQIRGFSTRKGKPSMWGAEPAVAPVTESRPARNVEPVVDEPLSRVPVVSHDRDDSGRSGRRGSVRADRSPRQRPPMNSDVEMSSPQVSDDFESPAPVSLASAGRARADRSEQAEPDRRSSRRPPRRGRSEEVQPDVSSIEPAHAADYENDDLVSDVDPESVPARDSRRGRGGRSERPVRDDLAPREERLPREERSPRQERAPHSERTSHGERGERGARGDRAPQSDRAPRGDRAPQGDRVPQGERSSRDEFGAAKDQETRTSRSSARSESGPAREFGAVREPRPERSHREEGSRRGRSRNEEPGQDNLEKPVRAERAERSSVRDNPKLNSVVPKSKRPSGFGEGLIDDEFPRDSSIDADPNDDFVTLDDDLAEPDDRVEPSAAEETESRPRRRRGRGRGKRGDRERTDSPDRAESPIDDESDGGTSATIRNTKIPSWEEAIGALVTVNMENHQRNPGNGRNQRGRGPRRDR